MIKDIVMLLLVVALLILLVRISISSVHKDQAIRINNLYQTILDETQTAVVAHDIKTGEIFYANEVLKRIYGVKGDINQLAPDSQLMRVRGKKYLELDYDELRQGISYENVEYHKTGRVYQVKGKLIDWDGREAYVEYLFDITDSKLFSEQLQFEHEELQRKYQEQLLYREKAISDDMIASSRINLSQGHIEEMRIGTQDGYERKYHYTLDFKKRLGAYTNQAWVNEEQNSNLSASAMLHRYLQGEHSYSEEYMAELKDGRHVWLKTDVKLVKRPETTEIIAFYYSRNVTREKILMNILERIMSFDYDEIFTVDSINGEATLMATGRYVLDEQMKVSRYEQELEKLKKRTASEEDAGKIETNLRMENILQNLQKNPVYLTEMSLMSKNGKFRLKQLRFVYLSQTLGTLLFTIVDIDDMVQAEKKKQEELENALQAAEEANAAKVSFLANMSHEIRTPMNVIIGLTSIIREESANQNLVLENVNRLESTSQYLLSLLNDILDMARIESGSVSLNKQEFFMKQFWETVNTLAVSQAKANEVRFEFYQEEGMLENYIGDSVRLQQILINLINNAIKFTPKDGMVTVSAAQIEVSDLRAKLRIQVKDTGIGMTKKFLAKAFQLFEQEYDSSTSTYGGSGLGLPIAKNFARMMDGDIYVESEKNVGTTFTVEVWLDIPAEHNEVAVQKNIAEGILFEGKRIMLVEDHPLNTLVAKRLLEKRKMQVVHAENGKKALELFQKNEKGTFDAILMDVRMPVMDGITATKKIRELMRADAKTIPIIAMTANAFDEDKQNTFEAGMNAHLAKPIEPEILYDTLARMFV